MEASPNLINSFAPIGDARAEILILGSMPGMKSLAASQYYAHQQNAFWKIIAAICGFDPQISYAERIAHLLVQRIAVWDVLYSCVREGSLDTAINTITVNNFEDYFSQHPHIQRVCFNGAAAERYYKRHVLLTLSHRHLHYVRLPSTSPAHANMNLAAKTLAWKNGLRLN